MTDAPHRAPEAEARALRQRLAAAARVLDLPDPDAESGELLDALLTRVARTRDRAEAWLVIVVLTTVFPPSSLVVELLRRLETTSPTRAGLWLLARTLPLVRNWGVLDREVEVVVDAVVADVDFSARSEHNSGIQRVVRNTMREWSKSEPVTLVAWHDGSRVWRDLSTAEIERVIAWDQPRDPSGGAHVPRLVVPWRSVVVLIEIPVEAARCLPLAALAEFSGNHVAMVVHDAIPVVAAETMPLGMSDHLAKYLAIVKHARIIVAVSGATGSVFEGFRSMLHAQALPGPEIVVHTLPLDIPELGPGPEWSERPLVLCVGNREPRKNSAAVLVAAERLWREGWDFELRFIGGDGWDAGEFQSWRRRLVAAGRPLTVRSSADDAELWAAYRDAAFTVFVSLEEGFGLPVAESLASGTPVLTSDYGSMAGTAAGGGCLTVDPRDDDAIFSGMRSLLSDHELRERLRSEALARPARTWAGYAADLRATVKAPR